MNTTRSDTGSPEAELAEAEARLAADRAALDAALDALRREMRPGALVHRVGARLKERLLPSHLLGAMGSAAPAAASPAAAMRARPAPAAGETAMAPDNRILAAGFRAIRDHPLISGALIAATGAALARAIPQRDAETRALQGAGGLAAEQAGSFLRDEALTLGLSLATSLAAALVTAPAGTAATAPNSTEPRPRPMRAA
jgi:hypothetical protein